MSPKRGERVAPPATPPEWEVVFGTSEAAKGWDHLCAHAASNTRKAWETMRTDPQPLVVTPRHHRLKGRLATRAHKGRDLPQWQIEVTGGGRIWYVADEDARTVFLMAAGPGHPSQTD